MNSIKLISLNICNDDDLLYGLDEITESDIDNFINYHKIRDEKLILDVKKLFNSRLRTKLDNNIAVVNDFSGIDYLHKSIISFYVHEERLRSIQIDINSDGKNIRYINNLDPEIVDNFMTKKKQLLIDYIVKTNSDFVLLQEVDSHYMITHDDMATVLSQYNLITPIECNQSFQKMMPGMLNNFILYKKSPTFKFNQSYLKEYGTVAEFNIGGKQIKIISGRWFPLKNNTFQRLKQLEMLDRESGKVIFMGDTNLRNNEMKTTYNVSDAIIDYKFSRYYTINKHVNQYFNDEYKYVARYDRIYSNGVELIYSDLCFNKNHEELKNIYRNSGYISDHFGLIAEFLIK